MPPRRDAKERHPRRLVHVVERGVVDVDALFRLEPEAFAAKVVNVEVPQWQVANRIRVCLEEITGNGSADHARNRISLRYKKEVNISESHPLGESHVDRLHALLSGEGMDHDWWVRMLLKYGQSFDPWPLPDEVAVMRERCCYLNCFTLATEQPERFTYFEGYGVLSKANGWGLLHAWCVDRSGLVVDPTWPNVKSDKPAGYIGLPIPLHIVEPYAYPESRGTIDGWLRDHRDLVETAFARLPGVDPV
jgi:hypothetical protein